MENNMIYDAIKNRTILNVELVAEDSELFRSSGIVLEKDEKSFLFKFDIGDYYGCKMTFSSSNKPLTINKMSEVLYAVGNYNGELNGPYGSFTNVNNDFRYRGKKGCYKCHQRYGHGEGKSSSYGECTYYNVGIECKNYNSSVNIFKKFFKNKKIGDLQKDDFIFINGFDGPYDELNRDHVNQFLSYVKSVEGLLTDAKNKVDIAKENYGKLKKDLPFDADDIDVMVESANRQIVRIKNNEEKLLMKAKVKDELENTRKEFDQYKNSFDDNVRRMEEELSKMKISHPDVLLKFEKIIMEKEKALGELDV